MNFISIVDYNSADPSHFEHVSGESRTVQGDSYTVQELFERHMKGQLPFLSDQSFYEDTEDFDAIDFQKLRHADPYEKVELLQDVQAKAKKAEDALRKWQKEQKSLDQDEEEEEDNVHFTRASKKTPKSDSKKASAKPKSEAQRSNEGKAGADEESD